MRGSQYGVRGAGFAVRGAGSLPQTARRTRLASLAWWWQLAAVAVIAAAIITATYQSHPSFPITIGQRVQDDPLVHDFNAAEQQPAATGGRAYRWTRAESSIAFPGIGRTAANVVLTMAGGANPNPEVTVLANNGEIARLRLTADFADYALTIPAAYLTTGNLTLTLRVAAFQAPGDRRDLGVLVSGVRVQPMGGLALPPRRTALALWGAVLLVMSACLVVGLRGWEAAAAALSVTLGFALLLVYNRLFATLGAGPWVSVAVGALLLAVALRLAVPPVMRRLGIDAGFAEARWLLAAVVGVFAMRLGGLDHPAMIVSDLVFHVHRFDDVVLRHIWYQEIPALYDQNRPVPYPPGAYLLFAPFAPFVRNRADLLTVGTQVLDATRIVVVGLVVWKATGDRIAAACATLLAGIVPIAFVIFSWGNLTNAVGEWALTLLFALLALGAHHLRTPWVGAGFVAVTLLALLSHIGVAVTTVALLAVALAVWGIALLVTRRAPWRERDFLTAVALTSVAGLLAVTLFYRIPLSGAHTVMQDAAVAAPGPTAQAGRFEIGGPRPDPSIGLTDHRTDDPFIAVAGQIGVEGYAFYRVWPLVLSPLGCWLLWRRRPNSPAIQERVPGFPKSKGEMDRQYMLCLACLVWLAVSLAFLIVGVLAGRYVRYAMTAVPAVATGAGVALGYGWRWRWGRGLVVALLAVSVVSTALIWYGRITRAYHT